MPITIPNFPVLSPEQANPILYGLMKGQQFGQNLQLFPQQLEAAKLQNAINQVKANYAQPMAQQDLQKAILYNQMYKPDIQSQINLRGAESGELSSVAELNRFKREHPEYLDLAASLYQSQMGQNQGQGNQQGQNQGQGQPSPYTATQPGNYSGGMNNPNMPGDNTGISNIPMGNTTGDYGLPAPSLSAGATNPLISKAIGVSPTDTAKMHNYYAQVQDQYNQYSQESNEASKAAIAANNMKQSLSVFNNAIDQTNLSGSIGGHIPAMTTAAQEADLASSKALPESVHAMKEAMGSARFSNLDLQQADKLNFTRTMNKGTRKLYTDWSNAAADRMMEYPQLINWAKNPANGVRIEDAKRMWQLYQQQNPIINKNGDSVNSKPKYPLSDYVTPEALASIREKGTYNPAKHTNNSEAVSDKMKSPSITIGKIKYIKGPDGEWYY